MSEQDDGEIGQPLKEWRSDTECGRCGVRMKTDGYTRWCPICS